MEVSESIICDSEIKIAGIAEPVILRYFETLNAEDFEATASLFAAEGQLHPPFESPVQGHDAIAAYLKLEAQGMKLAPREGIMHQLEDSHMKFEVTGKVQTRWFIVNVAWVFVINEQRELLSAVIKLLASPQELLNMRRR